MTVVGSTAHLRDVKGEVIHASYYDEYGAVLFLPLKVPSYQIVMYKFLLVFSTGY